MYLFLAALAFVGGGIEEKTPLAEVLKSYKEMEESLQPPPQYKAAKAWKNRAYLASYPRSGNHWLRYLIEEASGIATSTAYPDPDPPHLPQIYPWGGFCCKDGYEGNRRFPLKDELVLIKTHYPAFHQSWYDNLPYISSVRIVRHPVDCIYSHYVWVLKQQNIKPQYMIPRDMLHIYMKAWAYFQEYWDFSDNVYSFRYEDMYQDPAQYLKNTLETIGYPFTEESIDRAVKKYPATGGILRYIDHYTQDDLDIMQAELGDLMIRYGYTSTTTGK